MLLKRTVFTLMVLLMMQSMQFSWQAPSRALVIKDVMVIEVIEAKVKAHTTAVISATRAKKRLTLNTRSKNRERALEELLERSSESDRDHDDHDHHDHHDYDNKE